MQPVFIADVHLGKLARLLRMLGFDTLYNNNYSKEELATIALQQQPVLLTKNTAFLHNKQLHVVIMTTADAYLQLKHVMQQWALLPHIQPFTRCIVCNGPIVPVEKQMIADVLSQNTRASFHEFWQCINCKRVYWKGSHYERMGRFIAQLRS